MNGRNNHRRKKQKRILKRESDGGSELWIRGHTFKKNVYLEMSTIKILQVIVYRTTNDQRTF